MFGREKITLFILIRNTLYGGRRQKLFIYIIYIVLKEAKETQAKKGCFKRYFSRKPFASRNTCSQTYGGVG